MKLLSGLLALACVPAALAANNAPLPKDNVAESVAEKLDVTTLPSSIRPKPLKSKKTFADYGYVMRQMDDKQNLIEATPDGPQISIRILEQNDSSIYVCFQAPAQDSNSSPIQRVLLLKFKNPNGLLKGRESRKEFSGSRCSAVTLLPRQNSTATAADTSFLQNVPADQSPSLSIDRWRQVRGASLLAHC